MAGNILDLFCTNIASSSKCSISVIKPGLSDHYMIECTLNIGHTLVNELKNSSHMLLYDNVDKDGFRNSMGNLLVNIQNLVVNNTNINDMWSAFTAGTHVSVSEFVPSRYFKPRTPSQPV